MHSSSEKMGGNNLLADSDFSPSEEVQATPSTSLKADLILAQRCIRGEVDAWDDFYARYHDRLCRSIQIMLGSMSDVNLVDEIAARVWFALVANDGKLLERYTPDRKASLLTFMRAVARDEIGRYVRSEVRRRNRELTAVRQNSAGSDHTQEAVAASINEFLSTLSPREQRFCHEFLMQPRGDESNSDSGLSPLSAANIWQRTRRLYVKMLDFLRIKK